MGSHLSLGSLLLQGSGVCCNKCGEVLVVALSLSHSSPWSLLLIRIHGKCWAEAHTLAHINAQKYSGSVCSLTLFLFRLCGGDLCVRCVGWHRLALLCAFSTCFSVNSVWGQTWQSYEREKTLLSDNQILSETDIDVNGSKTNYISNINIFKFSEMFFLFSWWFWKTKKSRQFSVSKKEYIFLTPRTYVSVHYQEWFTYNYYTFRFDVETCDM